MDLFKWRLAAKKEKDWWFRQLYLGRAWQDFANGIAPAPEIEEGTFPHCFINYRGRDINFSNSKPAEFLCRLKQQIVLICPLLDHMECP